VPAVVLALIQGDPQAFLGGGTWQWLVVAGVEGVLLVSLSLWLLDVFRRRYNHQGRPAREMSRAAYAAFIFHQIVLVGLVLATREVSWPPEVDFLVVAVLGVAVSFALGGPAGAAARSAARGLRSTPGAQTATYRSPPALSSGYGANLRRRCGAEGHPRAARGCAPPLARGLSAARRVRTIPRHRRMPRSAP
jgi:hypothetical protein